MKFITGVCVFVACVCAPPSLSADQEERAGSDADLVPRHLLGLLHAPEVHRELNFTDHQVQELKLLFSEIDGEWFRSRVLSTEKQQRVVEDLEQRVHKWLAKAASARQRRRLQQLEYQAQGTRSLLREDVAQQLGLEDSQRERLVELARATIGAQRDLQTARYRGEETAEPESAAVAAAQAEREALKKFLRPGQLEKLSTLIGEPFNTSGLRRIYPMAPEFVPVEHWINSEPLKLRQLRGKVVLVHFYAFQCHNCHANFAHYRRWHEEFGDDVVVIGIQTPETARERDANAVRSAAAAHGLDFPILVDLESENWSAWANTMWPTVYVVDQDGYLRHWWQGELNWEGATGDKTIEDLVKQLLNENTSGIGAPRR